MEATILKDPFFCKSEYSNMGFTKRWLCARFPFFAFFHRAGRGRASQHILGRTNSSGSTGRASRAAAKRPETAALGACGVPVVLELGGDPTAFLTSHPQTTHSLARPVTTYSH